MKIEEEIQAVEVLLEQTNVAFQEQKDTAEKIHSKVAEIRDAIRSGKASTGDNIKDFIISNYGVLPKDKYAELDKGLRDLSTELSKHVGEMVLVITRSYNFHGCGGMGYTPQPKDYSLDVKQSLGVIETRGLILDINGCNPSISVTNGIHLFWNEFSGEWMIFSSPIQISYLITALGKPIYSPDSGREVLQKQEEDTWQRTRGKFGRPQDLALEIFIGNDKVEEYFKSAAARHKDLAIAYSKALRILGVTRPLPQELAQIIAKERGFVMSALIDDSSEKARWLYRALELEMHTYEWEYSYEKSPGVKVLINVPVFIRTQCEKYKIKIKEG